MEVVRHSFLRKILLYVHDEEVFFLIYVDVTSLNIFYDLCVSFRQFDVKSQFSATSHSITTFSVQFKAVMHVSYKR